MSPSETTTHSAPAAVGAFARALIGFAGRRAIPLAAAIMGGALLEGVGLAVLVPLLAVLTGRSGGRLAGLLEPLFTITGAHSQLSRLAWLLAAFVVAMTVRAVVLSIRDRRMVQLQLAFVEGERSALLDALGASDWREVAGLRNARIVQALDDNLEKSAAAASVLLAMIGAGWMLAIQWLLAWWIAPLLAGFGLVLMLIGAAVLIPTMGRAWRLGRSLQGERLALADSATQLLGGLKQAMAQGSQRAFIDVLIATGRRMTDQRLVFMRRYSATRIIGSSVASFAGAGAVLFGVWYGLALVPLIVGLAVLTRMVGPVTAIQQQAQFLMEYLPGHFAQSELRRELLAMRRPGTSPDAAVLELAAIVLNAVSYTHPGRAGHGITGASLSIAAGEWVGIAGPSGAGKTTLLDLIVGLYAPQTGGITVGGRMLDAAMLPAWRSRLAYVGQDPYLFSDTILRNLTFGAPPSTPAEVTAALALVGIDDFVASLPDGLDTSVGERGSRLSGGQRQRIVLARALLRRPALLILDEATSAIDVVGERAIFANLRALSPRPTTLVISHRAETLATCDRIVTVEAGRVSIARDRLLG